MFSAGGRNDWHSSRRSPAAIPFSSGIPDAIRGLVILLPYNDPETLERIVKQHWHETAAILVEPVLGNCGGILPQPGWLETIRRVCDEHGIVFIMDEVKTGFRLARGGAHEYFGVHSDLVTYAKALGNGYPIAAFAGKREIMQHIGQGVAHGGTYTGNRVGLAAASATLDVLAHTDALDTVAERGRELQAVITEVLGRTGRPFVVSGHPAMFSFWFAEQAPREYRDWVNTDHGLYDRVVGGLLKRGVMPEPDSREPWFMCSALSPQDIAETANALEDAAREALALGA
jgi:glutamate-1-semialdehyde 2,1-aminomutase